MHSKHCNQFEVMGIKSNTERKGKSLVPANSSKEVWNNPKIFGFRKVFNVQRVVKG